MVRIEYQSDEKIPADLEGDVSYPLFQEVRNTLVKVCKDHGPTGPMGFFPFNTADEDDCLLEWMRTADPNPTYRVSADQYNAARYQCVGCDTKCFTEAWILDLMSMLQDLLSWGVIVSGFPAGNVVVFADKIVVIGERFREVDDLASLVKNAQNAELNKALEDDRPKCRSCLSYFFENDKLVCEVDYWDDTVGTLTLDRARVKKIFQNPFTGDWIMSFKWGGGLNLPDEQTATTMRDWHCGESR